MQSRIRNSGVLIALIKLKNYDSNASEFIKKSLQFCYKTSKVNKQKVQIKS